MSNDHDPASRSVALDAVIRLAVEKVGKSSWYQTIQSPAVEKHADGDTSSRTVRRAMKDAEAMGWIEKKNYGNEFIPGPRAEEIACDGED